MAFTHKFSYEEKVKILSEYLDGTYGSREVCRRYNINRGSLKNWKRLYETFGWSGLKTDSKASHYSKEVKASAVQDYLCHALTVPEILKKYQIRSGTQLKRWIKKYNGHEELKSSETAEKYQVSYQQAQLEALSYINIEGTIYAIWDSPPTDILLVYKFSLNTLHHPFFRTFHGFFLINLLFSASALSPSYYWISLGKI